MSTRVPRSRSLALLRHSLPLLRPYWRRELELVGYMAFDLALGLAVPLSTKYLFDDIIARGDFVQLLVWAAAVLAILAVGSAASYRRVLVGGLIGELVVRDLRRAGFDQLQRLSLRFYARSTTGDLLSRITSDMDSVQKVLGEALPQLLFKLVSLIVGVVVLLLLNWVLGLVVLLVGVPTYAAVHSRSSRGLRAASRGLQDRIGRMMAFLQENLAAQMVVKSFSLETWARRLFEDALRERFEASMGLVRRAAFMTASSGVIFFGIRAVVLVVGAALVMAGRMTVGELVAFFGFIWQVVSPVITLSGQYQQLETAAGAFERIQELMDETPDVAEAPAARTMLGLTGEIRLERVTFRYGDREAGLHDLSLVIPAGARVAVVGPSGAGKSTLVGLLLRLYDPDQGRVLIDGVDMRAATLSSVRRQFAVVPQDTYLFNASIRDNIAVASDAASEAQVVGAARAAALHQVIAGMDAGYDTLVGERGVRLSGGQRQRMAIARALVRDPRVLILDEATSALDPATEGAIMETLDEVGRGRTTVMITHRLTSVVGCDTIFVLENGRLVEDGSHHELYQRGGLYWRLYSEQQAAARSTTVVRVEPWHLARVPLFASLGPSELAAVAECVTVERYAPGAVIVRQGEQASRMFVVGEGDLEVLVDGAASEPQRVGLLGPRSYFGEIALLGDNGARRNATVRAIGAVELYSLHKEDFLRLLETQPRLARAVTRLAERRQNRSRAVSLEALA